MEYHLAPGSGRAVSTQSQMTLPTEGRQALVPLAAATLLALGVSAGVAWAVGINSVFHVLSDPRPAWLVVCLAAQLVAVVGYAVAYREVARVGGGTELQAAWAALLTTVGFGAFLSKGGFAFDHRVFSRSRLRHQASQRVLGLGALEYAVLAPAAWASALALVITGARADASVTVPWIIGLPLGSVIVVVLLRRRHQLAARGDRLARVVTAVSSLLLLWSMARRPRHWPAFAGMALYWLAEVGSLWAALRAFGWSASVPATILGFATGYALTRRTLPLAGAGITEAFLSFALLWVGIPLAFGFSAMFAYRFFNMWLPTLLSASVAQSRSWRQAAPLESLEVGSSWPGSRDPGVPAGLR
jgi:uncharacterized membrane protein YbhN (UPF0104 family)